MAISDDPIASLVESSRSAVSWAAIIAGAAAATVFSLVLIVVGAGRGDVGVCDRRSRH
jgi:hypothetical protein